MTQQQLSNEMIGVFDMYFATLVGISAHPGYSRDNVVQPTIEQCAETAAKMIEIRNQYLKDGDK